MTGAPVPTIGAVRATRLADRPLTEPHPARLGPARPDRSAVLAAHRRALEAGEDGYTDPGTGRFVFSAAWLAARGTCCDTGCRHCPYVV
jgi:hypothetical protein